MTYGVKFTKSSQKEIKKQSPDVRLRILKAIYKLSANPKKGNVRPMVGSKNWRLRVGNYRIIYGIDDGKLTILVIKIGHRGKVYKQK